MPPHPRHWTVHEQQLRTSMRPPHANGTHDQTEGAK